MSAAPDTWELHCHEREIQTETGIHMRKPPIDPVRH